MKNAMENDLLCKAKSLSTGKWINGYIFEYQNKAYICWSTENNEIHQEEIDPKTTCKFSGKLDKEGTPICTNDILFVMAHAPHCVSMNNTVKKGIVVYKASTFYIEILDQDGRLIPLRYFSPVNLEVISNKYNEIKGKLEILSYKAEEYLVFTIDEKKYKALSKLTPKDNIVITVLDEVSYRIYPRSIPNNKNELFTFIPKTEYKDLFTVLKERYNKTLPELAGLRK